MRIQMTGAHLQIHCGDARNDRGLLQPLNETATHTATPVALGYREQIQSRFFDVEIHDRDADELRGLSRHEDDIVWTPDLLVNAYGSPRPPQPVLDKVA